MDGPGHGREIQQWLTRTDEWRLLAFAASRFTSLLPMSKCLTEDIYEGKGLFWCIALQTEARKTSQQEGEVGCSLHLPSESRGVKGRGGQAVAPQVLPP